jgi:hypothetical protein
MFNLSEFYLMLRRLVQAHAADDLRRLRSFAVVSHIGDALNRENLGKIALDYQNNMFWSLKWALAGYPPDEIAFDPDVLLIRKIFSEPDGRNGLCHTLEIATASLIQCTECSYQRTREQVDGHNAENLRAILNAVDTYSLYRNVNLQQGAGAQNYWFTTAEADYWRTQGIYIGNLPDCTMNEALTGTGRIDYGTAGADLYATARLCVSAAVIWKNPSGTIQ